MTQPEHSYSDSDPYPDDLRRLAELLNQNAARARRRGIYGLEDKLREAAESASSWARGLEAEEEAANVG